MRLRRRDNNRGNWADSCTSCISGRLKSFPGTLGITGKACYLAAYYFFLGLPRPVPFAVKLFFRPPPLRPVPQLFFAAPDAAAAPAL